MLTNFEKWKASLTPELVASVIYAVTDAAVCELCQLDGKCSTDGNACGDLLLAYFAEEVGATAQDAPTADELENFVRCADCIHGGWTDDVTTHCNKWHTRDDPMCVGYLGFCGAGEKGEMLELSEEVAE